VVEVNGVRVWGMVEVAEVNGVGIWGTVNVKETREFKFTLEQATKAHRGSNGSALLFL